MKKNNLIHLICIATLLAACSDAPESHKAEASEAKEVTGTGGVAYTVDTAASTIKWVGTKVTGYHSGAIPISKGTITIDGNNVTGGSITMNMQRISVSGPEGSTAKANAQLEGHLKSKDFFEVDKYNEAKFEITGIAPTTQSISDTSDPRQAEIDQYKVTNPTHMVSGNLTIKEQTKNISFPARITVSGNNVEAIAKFNIDRTQWNIVYPGKPDDLIRNDIHLGLSVKATRTN